MKPHVICHMNASIDGRILGSRWRPQENRMPGLFEQEVVFSKKTVDVAWFEKIAKQRLSDAFGGRVLDLVLPLGRNGLHEFSLMFAWANPSKPAKLAAKLATAVLK